MASQAKPYASRRKVAKNGNRRPQEAPPGNFSCRLPREQWKEDLAYVKSVTAAAAASRRKTTCQMQPQQQQGPAAGDFRDFRQHFCPLPSFLQPQQAAVQPPMPMQPLMQPFMQLPIGAMPLLIPGPPVASLHHSPFPGFFAPGAPVHPDMNMLFHQPPTMLPPDHPDYDYREQMMLHAQHHKASYVEAQRAAAVRESKAEQQREEALCRHEEMIEICRQKSSSQQEIDSQSSTTTGTDRHAFTQVQRQREIDAQSTAGCSTPDTETGSQGEANADEDRSQHFSGKAKARASCPLDELLVDAICAAMVEKPRRVCEQKPRGAGIAKEAAPPPILSTSPMLLTQLSNSWKKE
eukprot:TRINITY_DN36695_c0_g1_i1.p1 TRINITY_DN36695_c0_g1~~TRINITY_DN36695_c0_g1_i1.p1  ORF type:complete len:351 (-),score=75.08 TRINITY_DN36695_c0_g1_i1:297-1349(-)